MILMRLCFGKHEGKFGKLQNDRKWMADIMWALGFRTKTILDDISTLLSP